MTPLEIAKDFLEYQRKQQEGHATVAFSKVASNLEILAQEVIRQSMALEEVETIVAQAYDHFKECECDFSAERCRLWLNQYGIAWEKE